MRDRMMRALRWIMDVQRGYTRAADGLERSLEEVEKARSHGETAGGLVLNVEALEENRRAPGGLGVGARVAVSEEALQKLRLAALDARSESWAVPIHGEGGEA